MAQRLELQISQFSRAWRLEEEAIGKVQVKVAVITDGTTLVVSDRLFKDGKGAAA